MLSYFFSRHRHPLSMIKITFLLVLFYTSYSTAEYSYDNEEARQQVGEVMYGVPLEEHHHVMKREADQQIRLRFIFDPSVDSSLPSIIRSSVIPAIKQRIESFLMVRRTNVPILLSRQCTDNAFFPTPLNETRRCNTTCSNQTFCGAVAVPQEHLKACVQCDGDPSTCETNGTNGPGVTDADMVIYVSGIDVVGQCITTSGVAATSILAFAVPCQLEGGLDRPIAAAINFCPATIRRFNSNTIYYTTLHEIIHTLGFSSILYPFWRDEQGQPRTPRDEYGIPPVAVVNGMGRLEWSNTTITTVTYSDWETFNGNVSHTVNIMVTPAVVEYGRRHFQCPMLRGVELENQGGPATELSHWEKRILGNELMTGIIDSLPVLSNITLALLEDSGWYKVNFSEGQTLDWGLNSGCVFASRSCFQFMRQQNFNQLPIAPFCFTSSSLGNNQLMSGCTVGRKFSSLCNLAQYANPIPIDYQYFSNSVLGGRVLIADYCPFQVEINFSSGKNSHCSNVTNQPANNGLGETFGSGSACFNQPNRNWSFMNESARIRGAGCYLYTCNNDRTQLTIFVQNYPYTCQQPGQILTVNNDGYMGQLACPVVPSFARLCEEANTIPIVFPSPTPSVPDSSTINSLAKAVLLMMLFAAILLTM